MAILLAATDLGVGALFFQLHAPEDAIKRALGIPEACRLIGGLALGYADATGPPASSSGRSRRALPDVVHEEKW